MIGLWKAAGLVAAVAASGAMTMGGWAVVTVRDLPEAVVAGQSYRLEFQVRQHGINLLSGLEPRVVVRTTAPGWLRVERGEIATIAATAAGQGTYAATFTAPEADQVFLVIKNGFGGELRLYPVPVVAAGRPLPAVAAVDRGRALFVAKGCNTCHANTALTDRPDNRVYGDAPALGGRRFETPYLVAKLTRPASDRMPDLGLREDEVSALTAFLNGARPGAAAGGR